MTLQQRLLTPSKALHLNDPSQRRLHRSIERAAGFKRKHYPRLLRTFYRPTIERLITARQQQKLSVAEVNDMVGCADNLIAKYEAGLKMPSLYYLLLWCEALGVEMQLVDVDA
jgi:ribosome-binding protein aMBF1 (putative translation factor)